MSPTSVRKKLMQRTHARGSATVHGVVDRASGADLLNLALDAGPVPMQVGACLMLDKSPHFDLEHVRRLIIERVPRVARLRQRLVPAPLGCGRPLWIDDPAFDIDRHLTVRACPPSGNED